MIRTKDSHGAEVNLYQDTCELVAQPIYNDALCEDIEWQGGTTEQAIEWARDGKISEVPESDKLLAKLEAQLSTVATATFRTIADVVGGAVNVPDYIAGVPTMMRKRTRVHSDTAPITLIASISASSGVSADEMRKRGLALLTLARLLARSRPLTLWAGGVNNFSGTWSSEPSAMRHDYVQVDPSDLGRAAWALACPTHNRAVRVRLTEKGCSTHPEYVHDAKEYRDALANVFPGEHVYVFPRMGMGTPDEKLMLSDPVAWVIKRYNEMIAASE